jgi:hypothetical protein
MGMVKLGHVSIDGTKIKANASDKKTYDSKRIEREIARWLAHSETTDQNEDHQYGKDKTGDGPSNPRGARALPEDDGRAGGNRIP